MLHYRGAVVMFIAVIGAATAFGASGTDASIFPEGNTVIGGSALEQWDVPANLASAVKQNTGPIPTETALRDLLEEDFDGVDTDQNDLISYAEALAALPGLTQEAFDVVDGNGDGQISREEAENGGGCFGCFGHPGGILRYLGDIFLAALALLMMLLFGRHTQPADPTYPM